MAAYLTSADLIASVKRRASIPESQSTFTDADFLALANEELAIGLVPSILQYHEEYLVTSIMTPIIDNVRFYPVPSRAIGNRLRILSYVDNQGNKFEMTRLQPEAQYDMQRATSINGIYRFFMEGTNVVLVPGPTIHAVGNLEMGFFLRPNQLVLSSRAATVTGVDPTTGIITVDQIPKNFSTATLYDFVRPQSANTIQSYDRSAAVINTSLKTIQFSPSFLLSNVAVSVIGDVTTTITTSSPHGLFTGDTVSLSSSTSTPSVNGTFIIAVTGPTTFTIPGAVTAAGTVLVSSSISIAVGDIITQAEETIIPNIPTELHVVLAHRVAARCLESLGDQAGLQMANAKLQEMEVKTGNLIDNRVEGSAQKILNRNGILRLGKIGRRRNWL